MKWRTDASKELNMYIDWDNPEEKWSQKKLFFSFFPKFVFFGVIWVAGHESDLDLAISYDIYSNMPPHLPRKVPTLCFQLIRQTEETQGSISVISVPFYAYKYIFRKIKKII
jgi:hypothetical protein